MDLQVDSCLTALCKCYQQTMNASKSAFLQHILQSIRQNHAQSSDRITECCEDTITHIS